MKRSLKSRFFHESKILQKNLFWLIPSIVMTFYLQIVITKNVSTFLYQPLEYQITDLTLRIFPEMNTKHWLTFFQVTFWLAMIVSSMIPTLIENSHQKKVFGIRILLRCILLICLMELIRFVSTNVTLLPDPKSICNNNSLKIRPLTIQGIMN